MEAIVGGYIDGAVDGDLKTAGDITIGKNASINGNVYATNLMIYGKVFGNVICTSKAMIADKGYVKGNISGIIIDIEEGAVVEGIIKQIVEKDNQGMDETQPDNNADLNTTPVKKETPTDTDVMEKWF